MGKGKGGHVGSRMAQAVKTAISFVIDPKDRHPLDVPLEWEELEPEGNCNLFLRCRCTIAIAVSHYCRTGSRYFEPGLLCYRDQTSWGHMACFC